MTLALPSRRAALMPGQWVGNALWRSAKAVPSLDLRFADSKSLVDSRTGQSLVTFTRASSGTFVGSDGLLQTAATDVPRFDHAITSSRTNLLLRSEEFDNASWNSIAGGRSITANAIASPDGTITADTVTADGTSATHFISQTVTLAAITYTYSIYAKAGTNSFVQMRVFNAFGGMFANFNLTTGVTGTVGNVSGSAPTSSIQALPNGWYRCSMVFTSVAATSSGISVIITSSTSAGGGEVNSLSTSVHLWGAQLEVGSTATEYIPTTTAPVTVNTTESLGLLVEEQRTNSVTNNTMVGAVAGTPGTNPTGWAFATAQSNGLTISIAGTGIENGINYIDYRFNGTTVASPNACAFGFANATAATAQTWATSLYWKLASGTATGVTGWQLGIIENTAVGAFVTGAFYSQTAPTSAALITQRPTATRTLSGGVTVGLVSHTMNITVAGNTAIDFTIRIGMPQLEQGAFATSVIPTSTAAATRSADVASITGANFSSWYRQDEGTMFAEFGVIGSTGATQPVLHFNNGTETTRAMVIRRLDEKVGFNVTVSSITSCDLDSGVTLAVGSSGKTAAVYKVDDFAIVANASSAVVDTSGSVSTNDRANIGSRIAGTYLNGTIKRITFWPQRLANSTLQAITQ